MRQIVIGQILMVICCVFYLVWWYLGYRSEVVKTTKTAKIAQIVAG
jgi:hypothetical protein